MARLTIVQRSRKPFKCMGPCHKEIPAGSQYRRWRQNYRSDHVRCMECPTPPRSFFTTSEILSMAWDIADGNVPEFEDYDEFQAACDEVGEQIQEIVNLIQEKQDNIEQGFGHTQIQAWEDLDERRSGYEAWQEEVNQVPYSFDEDDFDADDARDALSEAMSNSPE